MVPNRASSPSVTAAIAGDSAGAGRQLAPLLAGDPHITVTGAAGLGDATLALLREARPQVLVVRMGRASDGELDTVRRVMAELPLPIVVCVPDADQLRARVLEAGAVACVEAPPAAAAGDAVAALQQAVRLMAEVKVVRRWARGGTAVAPDAFASSAPVPLFAAPSYQPHVDRPPAPDTRLPAAAPGLRVVGIGTSTGGPAVLKTILCGLPPGFPLPLLVVQHIASGFLSGMAEWLMHSCKMPVHIARYGEEPLPGHVYLAPDGLHMGVAAGGRILLAREASPSALCPSVAFLFGTLAEIHGPRAVGVLLTGMGKDGAQGLKLMKERGAITIAQDRDSSVVHGMPAAAIALGAATHVVPAGRIAATLAAIAGSPIAEKGSAP